LTGLEEFENLRPRLRIPKTRAPKHF